MNYLYFTEADLSSTAATGEGAMYPASSFLGLDPIGDTTTRISFKARNGTAVDDDILLDAFEKWKKSNGQTIETENF